MFVGGVAVKCVFAHIKAFDRNFGNGEQHNQSNDGGNRCKAIKHNSRKGNFVFVCIKITFDRTLYDAFINKQKSEKFVFDLEIRFKYKSGMICRKGSCNNECNDYISIE